MNKIVEDIELLRQKLGLEKIILVGHSGHGYMALEYAKKYSDHVSHLVLIALSPDASPENFSIAQRCFLESVCQERKVLLEHNVKKFSQKIEDHPERAFMTRMLMFGPMLWYEFDYDASWLWKDVDLIPEGCDFLWNEVFKTYNLEKNIKHLSCPVLLTLGRYDYFNPPHLWENKRSLFKDLTVRIFEKSGHTPSLEEPENFHHELIQWIQSRS